MTVTYDLISTTTLSSTASGVTLSGIPSTFTDIRVVVEAQSTGTTDRCYLTFNGVSTGGTYSWNSFLGSYSSSPSSLSTDNGDFLLMLSSTTRLCRDYPNLFIVDVFQYARTDINKSVLIDYSTNSDSIQYDIKQMICGLWKSTAAISSVGFNVNVNAFAIGSRFSVYGIKAE
jgi:hypothetical protein